MPNPADFTAGSAVHMEVARIGLGNGLDAPQSNVRLYFPPSSGGSGFISILHADHCGGTGIDSNAAAPTQYAIYSVNAGDGINWGDLRAVYNAPSYPSPPAGCGGYRTLNFSGLTASNVNGGYRGWYVAELYATHMAGQGGVNGFQIRMNTGGGLIGYSKGATSKFALQDRVNAVGTLSHFTMTFAPDCTLTGPVSRLLEWFDDDWGGIQTNPNYYTELVEYNSGGAVTSRVRIDPRQGNDQPGSASVTIRPNHRYAWTWFNVTKANGIQFLLPYDSINYDLPCPPQNVEAQVDATGNCGGIWGIYLEPDAATVVQARVRLSDGSYAQTLSTGGLPATGGWRSFSTITLPTAAKSALADTIIDWVRVQDTGPAGSGFNYDESFRGVPGRSANLGRCGTYNYNPEIQAVTADTSTGPKPGTVITVRARAVNVDPYRGPAYTLRLFPSRNGQYISPNTSQATTGAGINGNSATGYWNRSFTISSSVPHGTVICFRSSVTPDSSANPGGTHQSGEVCFSIYHLRFSLTATAPSDAFAGAGESVNIAAGQFNVCNSAPLPAGASRGLADNIQVNINTSAFNGGSNSTTTQDIPTGVNNTTVVSGSPCYFGPARNLTVPTTAVVGDRICATISATPRSGYSDRTGLDNTPVTDQFCVTVTNAPYLKVYGNDAWAGFEFSNGTSCSPGRGLVESIGRGSAGAAGEYGVFAYGNIDTFGSANNPLSHLMKFANTPTHGSYGANRCVSDYYGLLEGQASTTPQALNGLINGNNPDDGQYVYSGNRSTNGSNNYRKQQTILIDGDLEINGDIRYSGSYNRTDVPIIVFVVRGNIFVDPSVSQLDGIYIAIPDGANSGIIDTCAVDNAVNDYDPLGAPANGSGVCDDPLVVNGSFIAQNIYFRRTSGGINEAFTGNNVNRRCRHSVLEGGGNDERCAAEIFRFSPEAYLAQPYFDYGQPESYLQILQLRDLPPVF